MKTVIRNGQKYIITETLAKELEKKSNTLVEYINLFGEDTDKPKQKEEFYQTVANIVLNIVVKRTIHTIEYIIRIGHEEAFNILTRHLDKKEKEETFKVYMQVISQCNKEIAGFENQHYEEDINNGGGNTFIGMLYNKCKKNHISKGKTVLQVGAKLYYLYLMDKVRDKICNSEETFWKTLLATNRDEILKLKNRQNNQQQNQNNQQQNQNKQQQYTLFNRQNNQQQNQNNQQNVTANPMSESLKSIIKEDNQQANIDNNNNITPQDQKAFDGQKNIISTEDLKSFRNMEDKKIADEFSDFLSNNISSTDIKNEDEKNNTTEKSVKYAKLTFLDKSDDKNIFNLSKAKLSNNNIEFMIDEHKYEFKVQLGKNNLVISLNSKMEFMDMNDINNFKEEVENFAKTFVDNNSSLFNNGVVVINNELCDGENNVIYKEKIDYDTVNKMGVEKIDTDFLQDICYTTDDLDNNLINIIKKYLEDSNAEEDKIKDLVYAIKNNLENIDKFLNVIDDTFLINKRNKGTLAGESDASAYSIKKIKNFLNIYGDEKIGLKIYDDNVGTIKIIKQSIEEAMIKNKEDKESPKEIDSKEKYDKNFIKELKMFLKSINLNLKHDGEAFKSFFKEYKNYEDEQIYIIINIIFGGSEKYQKTDMASKMKYDFNSLYEEYAILLLLQDILFKKAKEIINVIGDDTEEDNKNKNNQDTVRDKIISFMSDRLGDNFVYTDIERYNKDRVKLYNKGKKNNEIIEDIKSVLSNYGIGMGAFKTSHIGITGLNITTFSKVWDFLFNSLLTDNSQDQERIKKIKELKGSFYDEVYLYSMMGEYYNAFLIDKNNNDNDNTVDVTKKDFDTNVKDLFEELNKNGYKIIDYETISKCLTVKYSFVIKKEPQIVGVALDEISDMYNLDIKPFYPNDAGVRKCFLSIKNKQENDIQMIGSVTTEFGQIRDFFNRVNRG